MAEPLSGQEASRNRALACRAQDCAEALGVQERYPNYRVFRIEHAKEGLMKTGVRIKGTDTGPTMRSALAGSPDWFEPAPSQVHRWWPWK